MEQENENTPAGRADVERFLRDALRPDREPLVVWPAETPAPIMQRAAFNLAADSAGAVDFKNVIPADIAALACPQGISTVALARDLTALATLEKARLVCECDGLAESPLSPEREEAAREFRAQLKRVEALRRKRVGYEKEYHRKVDQLPSLEQRLADFDERREQAEQNRPALQEAIEEPMTELIDLIVGFRYQMGLKDLNIPSPTDGKAVMAFATKHRTEISQASRKHSSRRRTLERSVETAQQAVDNTQQTLTQQEADCARKEEELAAVRAVVSESKALYEQALHALENAGIFHKKKLENELKAVEVDLRAAQRQRDGIKRELAIIRSNVESSRDVLATNLDKLATVQSQLAAAIEDEKEDEVYKAHLDEFDPVYHRAKSANDALHSCDNEISRATKGRTAPEKTLANTQKRIGQLEATARDEGMFFLVDDATLDALLAGAATLDDQVGASAAAGLAAYDRERAELLRCAQALIACN